MTIIDQEGTMPKAPLGPSRQLLRLAGLTVAVVANIACIGFLLYAAYDLAMLRRTLQWPGTTTNRSGARRQVLARQPTA